MKLKIESFLFFSVLTFFLVGCQTNEGIQEGKTDTSVETTNNLTKEEQEAVDNGYPIGEYTIYLSEKNKKSKQDVANFIDNGFFKDHFTGVESQIDRTKQLNMITYGMRYSPEEEMYLLAIFFVNTSVNNIKELRILVKPKFKNLGEEGEFIELTFEDEISLNIPPNGVVPGSITASAPIEYMERLKQNTAEDITFEIKELEINGERVENVN